MFGTPLRRFSRDLTDNPQELRRDRARNNLKLKSKFERIFEKYGRDFEGVGDEIDLATGQVVVDNGHLARMQHERDTGSTPSRRFVRAFTQELGGEDHQESRALNQLRAQSRIPGQTTRSPIAQRQQQDLFQAQRYRNEDVGDRTLAHLNHPSTTTDPQSALVAMAQPHGVSGGVNPDAINSLGNALATQIASFLNQQLVSQLGTLQPSNPWAVPPLPNSDHAPDSASVGLMSPTPAPGGVSIWAPYDDDDDIPRRGHSRRRLRFEDSIPVDDSDEALPSIESPHIRRNGGANKGKGDPDECEFEREMLQYENFLNQATYTFQTLAHGFANRSILDEKETQGRTKKGRSRAVNGHEWPEGNPSNVRRFTIEEDRIILRMKKKNKTSSEIARFLPGRTEGSIAVRYSRALKPGAVRYDQDRFVELADGEEDDSLAATARNPSVTVRSESSPASLEDNDLGTSVDTNIQQPDMDEQEIQRDTENHPEFQQRVGNNLHFGQNGMITWELDRNVGHEDIDQLAGNKRKRAVSEEAFEMNVYSEELPFQVKRKRGRPRKYPRPGDLGYNAASFRGSSQYPAIFPYGQAFNHLPQPTGPLMPPSQPTLTPTVPRGPPQPFKYAEQAALSRVFSVKPRRSALRPSRRKDARAQEGQTSKTLTFVLYDHNVAQRRETQAPAQPNAEHTQPIPDTSIPEETVQLNTDDAHSTPEASLSEDGLARDGERETHCDMRRLFEDDAFSSINLDPKPRNGEFEDDIGEYFPLDPRLISTSSYERDHQLMDPESSALAPRLTNSTPVKLNSRLREMEVSAPYSAQRPTAYPAPDFNSRTTAYPALDPHMRDSSSIASDSDVMYTGLSQNGDRPRSGSRKEPRASTPRTIDKSASRDVAPNTPINRKLLSSRKIKSGQNKASMRSTMFRQRLSSPAQQTGVLKSSKTPRRGERVGTPIMLDASDDDL
ncbi:hypothetical protein K461DRAFT_290799 [Myriangium duriaei CBS 260.36]|uniref:HTH myb-type domain-containing protein n=1 Tax=Myriangium duriaei CBS 260.36 TaxID=1168546 RepID=A0A9P4JB72_9PEZI|nr:hypothetical protein K461DRAFT_290799 [Myriangium duriaei CBS 260.36]